MKSLTGPHFLLFILSIFLSSGPPATEQALDDIEYRLQRPLPKELRCSYRICNGQNLKTSHSRETEYGLLGMLIANNYSVCEVLLSAEGILRNLSQV